MVENKSSLFGIIAIIIGASGLGLGAFSMVNFQTVEGPQGLPGEDGEDGTDGQDIVGLQVGILDPDQYEIVSGLVEVRVLLWNSSECSINVFINGSLNATSVPWVWNTTTVNDGWWNISVSVTDTESNNAQDEILIYVSNNPEPTPIVRAHFRGSGGTMYETRSLLQGVSTKVDFNDEAFDTRTCFNLGTDTFTAPEDGYYLFTATVMFWRGTTGTADTYRLRLLGGYSVYTEVWVHSSADLYHVSGHITLTFRLGEGDTVHLEAESYDRDGWYIGFEDWISTFITISKL